MMMLHYKVGSGVKNLGKSDYVVCERSQRNAAVDKSSQKFL